MSDSFSEKLKAAVETNNSLLCVGLDPDVQMLPKHILRQARRDVSQAKGEMSSAAPDDTSGCLLAFNKAIIEATHDLVCVYKPNSAFYEAHGAAGVEALKKTCDYLHASYPSIPIILDAKRGDIGNTNRGYAEFAFEYLGVDAITVHPYQGLGALESFTHHEGKGIIVLCHTSNPEASEFQEVEVAGMPLYMHVAGRCHELYQTNTNVSVVIGATYPAQMRDVRAVVGNMNMLVPGIGAQGGSVKDVVENGLNQEGAGLIINSSRGVLYASGGEDFADAARKEALRLRDEINKYRSSQS